MKKEILFRGKTKSKDSKWITGDLNHVYDGIFIFDRVDESELNSPDNYEVIPETVGQFTGILSDKKAKIFEGDIVKKSKYPYTVFVVDFDRGKFNVSDYTTFTLKLIGNIHDNPELL